MQTRLSTGLFLTLVSATLVGCPGGPKWDVAFDATTDGALSGVWGSGPDDVWIVGGYTDQAQIFHYDGADWSEADAPAVPLLAWSYGWGPDNAIAVGLQGAVARWDGNSWTALDSGETQDLWGVWGTSDTDVWIVGGTVGEANPVILHYDGTEFTNVGLSQEQNTRGITSLFKVWGIGGKTFALGETGQVVEYDGTEWVAIGAGERADQDFVSLWGPSVDNIVAVGGRGNARIAEYDGTSWTTIAPERTGGLNAVFMDQEDVAIVGWISGYVGAYYPETDELVPEDALGSGDVHAIWGDGEGRYYAVGGRVSEPFSGLAVVRTGGYR